MPLPADIARCIGRTDLSPESETCPHREGCERYRDFISPARADSWDRTPVSMWLCGDGYEFLIPLYPAEV
jgi:hypothetical protein